MTCMLLMKAKEKSGDETDSRPSETFLNLEDEKKKSFLWIARWLHDYKIKGF